MDSHQLRELIIRPVLKELGMWSEDAEELMMGTCATESHLGHYIKQVNGPALGIMQMEPFTHDDIMINYLGKRRPDLLALVKRVSSVERCDKAFLITNLKYAVAMPRIKYWMVSEPIPSADDLHALGSYYKLHYNSIHGKGTVERFIADYERFVI